MNEILFTVTFGYYLISVKENIYRIMEFLRKVGCSIMAVASIKLRKIQTNNEYVQLIGKNNKIKYKNHTYSC